MGNLEFREDYLTSQKEVFEYDNLNRLTGIDYYLNSAHITGADFSIVYSDAGNITSKTDVGPVINYGEAAAGPHALTSIEDPVAAYQPPPQAISYTSFNKVSNIQDTLGVDSTLALNFTYGLNNQRVKTVLQRYGTVERIRYFGSDYQEDSTAAGTKKYHYIHAPTGLIGIFVKEGSADTMYHVLTDHLGSLTTVINAETNQLQRYSYSSWGQPRDPDEWTSRYTSELFAGRGFTGHEHLQAFDLINMNGRVYDPVLARFLSPDPFVQFPGAVNGFNRYSYVMNNPLKFTDPSGYMTDPSGSKFSTYGDAMWNKGGNFYYRGWYYAKNPQGYTIWGNSLISGPVGFAAGETYRSSNASHAWKYDYANDTYRNKLTGELYDPKNSFDFNSFWRQSSFETWKFSGAYFFYESEGATHLFIDGTLNRIEGTVTNNPSEAGSNSHIAANGGGDLSLAGLYAHFQIGGGEALNINMSSVDFGGASQRDLGLVGMQAGDVRAVQLFRANPLTTAGLAFGRVNMMAHGNNQFSIVSDNSARFDFVPLIDRAASLERNVGNVIGAGVNYNVFLMSITPLAPVIPLIFGGPFDVNFNGTTTIPR